MGKDFRFCRLLIVIRLYRPRNEIDIVHHPVVFDGFSDQLPVYGIDGKEDTGLSGFHKKFLRHGISIKRRRTVPVLRHGPGVQSLTSTIFQGRDDRVTLFPKIVAAEFKVHPVSSWASRLSP